MNGRERLLNTLNGRGADRIPVTLFIQSQGHFAKQLDEEYDPWNFEKTQKSIIDYQRSLGLDVHARMLFFNPYEPVLTVFQGLNAQTETECWKVTVEKEEDGYSRRYRQTIHTPEGNLHQTFTVNEIQKGTFMYACTEAPIRTRKDLELAEKYEPFCSQSVRRKMAEQVKIIKDYVGEDGIVSAWSNGSLFNNISSLIDQTELYALFLTDPEFYDRLMSFAKKRVYDYTDILLDAGVDAICLSGNAAGGVLGNPMFEKYVLPYEQKYIAYCQRKGNPVIYHNCGRVMELVPSYLKMGAKNIEPFSPAPLGNGDLRQLKGMLAREFSVTSGVDQIHILQSGTPEMTAKAVEKVMEQGKDFQSFIMQNVDFLEYGTPMENIKVYADTALSLSEKYR